MIPPQVPNDVIYRGDTFVRQFRFWADASHMVPYVLTGIDEILAEVRVGTGTPVLATFQSSLISENELLLVLSADQTSRLTAGASLQFDIQTTEATTVTTIARGLLSVVGDITESDFLLLRRKIS